MGEDKGTPKGSRFAAGGTHEDLAEDIRRIVRAVNGDEEAGIWNEQIVENVMKLVWPLIVTASRPTLGWVQTTHAAIASEVKLIAAEIEDACLMYAKFGDKGPSVAAILQFIRGRAAEQEDW